MAKIKKTEQPVDNKINESSQNEETQQSTEKVEEKAEEKAEEKVEEKVEEKAKRLKQDGLKIDRTNTATTDIPDNVLRILKLFRNMSELYVSKSGSVFTPDTKPSLRGNAILYKNPFYNSKS